MDTRSVGNDAEPPDVGRNVDVDGIATNYHEMGDAEPPIVLIHGSGPGVTAWANWRLALPLLGEKHRVVAPDVVGFGYTARPKEFRFDLTSWRNHLLGFLDALGLERVALVGNSFGGALALSIATHAPDRVAALILMGSVGVSFPITDALDTVWGYTPSLDGMQQMLELFVYDRSILTGDLVDLRYEASRREEARESYERMFPPPRQRSVDALATPEDLIRSISCPTLVLHGREDQVIPLDVAYRLLSMIDDAELHVFGRCGHWTQIERASAFATLVSDFVKRRANP